MSYPVPTPEADSYGTVEGVASYVGIFTDDGVFNSTTNPTHERVIIWIDQVSDMFNISLSSVGFVTPITQVDAVAAIGAQVEQLVSDLVWAANAKGRFFSDKFQAGGKSIMGQIQEDINNWVSNNTDGLSNLDIPRVTGTLGRIGSKGLDASGDETPFIFQRKAFGNTFTDWTG